MLKFKNLSLYLKQDLRLLLKDFNYLLPPGPHKIALIGEEGNGKSTLLKAIARPEEIDPYVDRRGDILCSGELIGYLPQILGDDWGERSNADLLLARMPWEAFDYRLYYQLLDQLHLDEQLAMQELPARTLSGGEKIKFALLLELLQRPSLLLLDEPSNDLDLDSLDILQNLIKELPIPVIFVSHDETLLNACADTLIHFEQLRHKSEAHYSIAPGPYSDYVAQRQRAIDRQNQQARKDLEIHEAKMERYRHVYERVQHELRTVSRQDPGVAKNLKDKMHAVKSMGRRFEREKERLTPQRLSEDSIDFRFSSDLSLPGHREWLHLSCAELKVGERVLSREIELRLRGSEKLCLVGPNGCGKSTLLRLICSELDRLKIPYAYMPQYYDEALELTRTPVEFLTRDYSKEEHTRIRSYLGSLKFTVEEMLRPISSLSGGQKAKLYFAKLMLSGAGLLILDEPTRNLSPLSGPEIREALRQFQGAIIAVSHDRLLIETVFDRVLELGPQGLTERLPCT